MILFTTCSVPARLLMACHEPLTEASLHSHCPPLESIIALTPAHREKRNTSRLRPLHVSPRNSPRHPRVANVTALRSRFWRGARLRANLACRSWAGSPRSSPHRSLPDIFSGPVAEESRSAVRVAHGRTGRGTRGAALVPMGGDVCRAGWMRLSRLPQTRVKDVVVTQKKQQQQRPQKLHKQGENACHSAFIQLSLGSLTNLDLLAVGFGVKLDLLPKEQCPPSGW